MNNFQRRVVDEKAELDEKLGKLKPFLDTKIFAGLSTAEQDRLRRQFGYMQQYSEVLGERIACFSPPVDTGYAPIPRSDMDVPVS